jgi:proline iminopeptidase
VPFLVKDPRGYQEFQDALAAHDAKGSANTMRKFQGERPPVHAFDADIRKLALPVLIVVGDEDDPSGHTVNLEEPALFNRTVADFIARVEAGRWEPRAIRPQR